MHVSGVVTDCTWNVKYEGAREDLMTAGLHGNIASRNLGLREINWLTLRAAGKGKSGRGSNVWRAWGK